MKLNRCDAPKQGIWMEGAEMEETKNVDFENRDYWNHRAAGYSEVNKEELAGVQRGSWTKLLVSEIGSNYPGVSREQIRILDIGAGPGFLSIILAENGFDVTAADFSAEMIEHAQKNAAESAGEYAEKITFGRENAEDLSFGDKTFDVVISRNLTWNLPHPEEAYKEWLRVLKPNGLMLVFDANWYHYLRDEESRQGYEQDRKNVESAGLGDYNIGDNFDKMEKIADRLPMTGNDRPCWDKEVLQSLGQKRIEITEDIGSAVYSEKEKINYSSTPMFMIKVVKEESTSERD